jgi:hypothetical protein
MQHQIMLHLPDKRHYFMTHIKMQDALHFIINDRPATLTQRDRQCIHKILTQYSFKYRDCYMSGYDLLINLERLQTVAQITPTPSHVELLQTVAQITPTPSHVELLQTAAQITPTPSHVELLQTVAQVTPIPNPIPLKVAEVTPIPNPNAGGWGYGYGQYVLGAVVLGIGVYLG